ncbi:MAG: hypothetical protein QF473_21395 [Planctomycetota bacterium]|jgi:hypothetical protein|nr:hypothetical protein [Planctomycetota bacterium]
MSDTIQNKLKETWGKERQFAHLRGFSTFAIWTVGLIFVDLLLDWLFLIPGQIRFLLLIANVITLGVIFHKRWWQGLNSYDAVRVALQVEGRHPEFQNLLVSYIQFDSGAATIQHASPRLIEAMQNQTIRITEPISFKEIIDLNELKNLFLFSAAMFIVFALACVSWPTHFRILAIRMFNPGAEEIYPTDTSIKVLTPQPLVVRQGDPILLNFQADGVIPGKGLLEIRPQGMKSWEQFQMLKEENTPTYDHEIAEAFRSFDYRARIGDAMSRPLSHVEVVPPPQVVTTRVRLRYPLYMKLDEQTIDTLNFDVFQGTRIQWSLTFDQPLSAAEMQIADSEPKKLKISEDGLVAQVEFAPKVSFHYQFKWTLKKHPFSWVEDIHYFVQVMPDVPPRVDILQPLAEKEKATRHKSVEIKFSAEDDHGISQSWLVYKLNDGEERRKVISKYDKRAVTGEYTAKLTELVPDIKEGNSVTYYIEVADSHMGEGGRNRGRSEQRIVSVVSIEAYLKEFFARKEKLDSEILNVQKVEQEGSLEVKALKASEELSTDDIEEKE